MRTTLTLDDDVIDKTRTIAHKLGKPFKVVVNEALRLGLEQVERPMSQRPYQTKAIAMGLRKGYSLDNIQELLSEIEGEDCR